MSFEQDPGEQAQISASDFAQMCEEMSSLRKQLELSNQMAEALDECLSERFHCACHMEDCHECRDLVAFEKLVEEYNQISGRKSRL